MLKRVNVSILMDTTQLNWSNQVDFVLPAVVAGINQLSGIMCDGKMLGAKRTNKQGVASLVRLLLEIPAGADNGETYENGSAVGNAFLHPNFRSTIDTIIVNLCCAPSAILDIDAAQNQALVVQAPGLIMLTPPPSTVALQFQFISSGTFNTYNLITTGDIAPDSLGGISWRPTPLITQGNLGLIWAVNDIITPNYASNDWLFTTEDNWVDANDTQLRNGKSIIDSNLLKTENYVDDVLSTNPITGAYIPPCTSLQSDNGIVPLVGGSFRQLSVLKGIVGSFQRQLTRQSGQGTTNKFVPVSRALKFTNTTGSAIIAGSTVASFQTVATSIVEINEE